MALQSLEIDHGRIRSYFKNRRDSNRYIKQMHHRRMRRLMKNLDFVPRYNRFNGWLY